MLQVREQQHHQTQVLTLIGQFSRRNAPGIQVLILAAKETGYHHIVLDFSQVIEIDSTSLRDLLLWYQNMKPSHFQLSVVKPPSYSHHHFDWGHLSELVPTYASEKDAVDHAEACS